MAGPLALYMLRRIGHAALVLWATFTAAFLLLYWLPGDAALSKIVGSAGSGANLQVEVERLRHELGYDRPGIVQYLDALASTATGDWGRSIQTSQPVAQMFAEAIPETLKLSTAALVLGSGIGVALALVIAGTRSQFLRQLLLGLTAAALAVPTFWIGLLAIEFFSFRLGWLPAFGNRGASSLVLPALVLAVPTAATTAQLLVASLRATLDEPFIAMARAKVGSRRYVLYIHALRCAARSFRLSRRLA